MLCVVFQGNVEMGVVECSNGLGIVVSVRLSMCVWLRWTVDEFSEGCRSVAVG